MRLIWATRGKTWGFRFLRNDTSEDPLVVYERAFSGKDDEREMCHDVADGVALRLQDPEGREDRAGRPIPHDFVVLGPGADDIRSVADGLRAVWPEVADDYASCWDDQAPDR